MGSEDPKATDIRRLQCPGTEDSHLKGIAELDAEAHLREYIVVSTLLFRITSAVVDCVINN